MLRRRSHHSAEYRAHIASKEWRTVIRPAALERANHRCAFCGLGVKKLRTMGRHLEVHHNNYSSLGHEQPEDLTVLCAGGSGACHALADRQRRAAAGRKPTRTRRTRSRRRRKRSRTMRAFVFPFAWFVTALAGLKVAAIVLPTLS